jgi:hypothetical protein
MTAAEAVVTNSVGRKEIPFARWPPGTRRKPEIPVALTDTSGSVGRAVGELAKIERRIVSVGFRLGADKRTVSPSVLASTGKAPGPDTRSLSIVAAGMRTDPVRLSATASPSLVISTW